MFKPSILFDKINQLYWYKQTHRQWFDELNLKSNAKVLEIGCASGVLTSYIDASGFIPTGLDSSKEMIELANKNNSHIEFIKASALDLPFENESFESIITASLLNIIPDRCGLLNEIFRTSKYGARISILVPNKHFNDRDLDRLIKNKSLYGFSSAAIIALHNKPPKMSTKEISKLLKQAGFIDIKYKFYLEAMVVSVTANKPYSV